MSKTICIKELTYSYGKNAPELINNLNFSAETGSHIIIGPNGSGKSTLIKILASSIPSYTGTIQFNKKELNSISLSDTSKTISYLPQYFSRNFPVTVKEFLSLSDAELDETNDIFGIYSLLSRNITELSGGELQKVNVTRVLLQDTPVILLDEPNTHLDITSQFLLFETIKKLEKTKVIIIVLHDLQMASRYFNNFILIGKYGFNRTGKKTDVFNSAVISEAFHSCVNVVADPVWGGYYVQPVNQYSGTTDGISGKSIPGKNNTGLKIHVVTGGGAGTEVFTELKNLENIYSLKISVGVINKFDTDWFIAKEYGYSVICEKPYSEITETAFKENIESLNNSDLIIYIPHFIGKGNVSNVTGVIEAVKKNISLIVIKNNTVIEYIENDKETENILFQLKQLGKDCEKDNLEEIIGEISSMDDI